MTLPQQVRDQAAQIERMMDEIKNNAPQNDQQQVPRNDEQQVNPSVNPDVVQSAQQNVSPEVVQNAQQFEIPQPETLNWEERALKAEQRYQVLQGKYNKEIQEVRQQSNEHEVSTLKNEIAQLRQQLTDAAAKPAAPMVGASLDELREDYGSELIDGLRAAIMAEVNSHVSNVQRDVQQDSFATKQALLSQRLAGHSIDFQSVNSDPLFHEWLSKFDPNTGVQRQQTLTDLFNRGQIDATAAMFTDFVSGGTQQTNASPFNQHVQQPTTAPAAPIPQPAPAYSPAQIAQFYSDWARGKYTAEEANRIEREIINSNSSR